jgi:cytochrome c-type biogenesis protein CcmF
MIVETGHYALVLAFALCLVQMVVPLWGSLKGDRALMAIAAPVSIMQFLLVALSFAALTYAYLVSDFSVLNVVENSHSQKPLIYKISGVWGNHEGSMLLWVLTLALFGALVALRARRMPEDLSATALSIQSWVLGAFLLFILLTSNPFARVGAPPMEGRDLNPLLQDPGLAIHPPLLYLGYVGLSITFSFAAAALIHGRIDAQWARWVRPWTLIAWMFLTVGISMGSYWAYYTLGWGGFWFWDPVENASLMPWLAATALLHSALVMEKRDALKVWTILLAILAFSLSLLGAFLVRSGVLTSVHSFATDPQRGVFILLILVFFIGGSLSLFAFRVQALKQGGIFAPVSREGALVFNNLLLTTSCATVFVGTLYPLALEAATGAKISVGPPFFNLTFAPLFVPIFLAMPLGQLLAWKRGDLLGATQRLAFAIGMAVVAGLLLAFARGEPVLAVLFAALAVYVIVGAFIETWSRITGGGFNPGVMWRRAVGLPLSQWGTAIAHAGAGVTLFGLAATGWGVEQIVGMKPGHNVGLGPYTVTLESVEQRKGPNYVETAAHMVIREGGVVVGRLDPSRKFYAHRSMTTTEAGLRTIQLGQVHIVIPEQNTDGSLDVRLYWKPYVTLIWIGSIFMFIGGGVSLADRRLRVGYARRPRQARGEPTPAPSPAE